MNETMIREAWEDEASAIAQLIMTAMNHECCLYFCGAGHTLKEFHQMMTTLVQDTESQYSYTNTLVAVCNDTLAGIAVSYDGALLHRLRHAFLTEAKRRFHQDFGGMDDETAAGELYVDSLAVGETYRHRGIGTQLLLATKDKAHRMGIKRLGLLVDKGNPKAEKLYSSIGFEYVNDASWGGHPMRHLQMDTDIPSNNGVV